MAQNKNFDADKKAADRKATVYTIGGRNFHARKRTVNLMKEWAEADPMSVASVEQLRKVEEESPLDFFASVSKQLNVLLRDEEDEEPGTEFLDENLDLEEGFELLDRLTPKPGGNPTATAASTMGT